MICPSFKFKHISAMATMAKRTSDGITSKRSLVSDITNVIFRGIVLSCGWRRERWVDCGCGLNKEFDENCVSEVEQALSFYILLSSSASFIVTSDSTLKHSCLAFSITESYQQDFISSNNQSPSVAWNNTFIKCQELGSRWVNSSFEKWAEQFL